MGKGFPISTAVIITTEKNVNPAGVFSNNFVCTITGFKNLLKLYILDIDSHDRIC